MHHKKEERKIILAMNNVLHIRCFYCLKKNINFSSMIGGWAQPNLALPWLHH
jgi:hypothetical protein